MDEIDSTEFAWDDWAEDEKIDESLCYDVAEFALSLAIAPSKTCVIDELNEAGDWSTLYSRWLGLQVKTFLKKTSNNNIKFEDVGSPDIRIAALDEETGAIDYIESRMRREAVQSVCKVEAKPIVSELLYNVLINMISSIRPHGLKDSLLSINHYILISHFTLHYHIESTGKAVMKIDFMWIPFKK